MSNVFKHWSASQVSSFRLCNRKWYFAKILGIEEPESAALVDGKRYAQECETYMKTGSTAGMSACTRPVAALHGGPSTFPKPGHRNTLVEYPIGVDTRPEAERTAGIHATLLDVDGLPGVGFMDVCDIKEDRPIVWDFKSTKAKRWIKTSDELRSDVQMSGIYAKAVTLLHQARYGKPPQAVGVAHVALLKPPESAEAVVVGPAWLTLDDIEAQWEGIKTSVRSMKEVALLPSADRVTPSWSACSSFGGCPHRDRCQAIKTMSTSTQTPGNTMTLLEKLAAAQGAKPTAPVSTITVSAGPAASAPPTNDLAAKIRARLATPGQINPPDAANPAADKGLAAAVAPKVAELPRAAQIIATYTPKAAPTMSVTIEAPGPRRAPRNGDKRLAELGWDEYAISCMSVDRKHEVLDGKLQAPVAVEADMPPEEAAPIDLNSNEALELGESLGWTEEQMNDMEDAVFARILKGKLLAAGWTVVEDGDRIVDLEIIHTKEVVPVAVEAPKRTRRPTVREVVEAAPVAEQLEEAEREARSVEAAVAAEQEAYVAEKRATIAGLEEAKRKIAAQMVATPIPVETPADIVANATLLALKQAQEDGPAPLMLFIDCRPTKGFADAVELTEYCVPLMQMVCERKKVEAYNLPSFNEGEKLVSALLLMNPPSGMVLVDTSSPLTKWALEVLLPLAKMVVRGVGR